MRPPSGYTFEVHAADSDGHWSGVPATLPITIHPPYWRSNWAYLLYVVLFAGLISWLYHYVATLRRSREYRHLSHYDGLTGIYNRAGAEFFIRQNLTRARNSEEFALLIIDVDHFKTVNDTLGHNTGDHVLQAVARLIKTNIRHTDILGRWGGDEMVLLVSQLKPKAGQVVATNIQRAIRTNDFNLGTNDINVSISIGIAYSQPKERLEDLLQRADMALYHAKQEGRNTSVELSSLGKYTNVDKANERTRPTFTENLQ